MAKALAGTEVFALIDPADPDNLTPIENGEWRATWSPSTPHAMDVEIIRRTEGVTITKEPHTPTHLDLPGWMAIHFKID